MPEISIAPARVRFTLSEWTGVKSILPSTANLRSSFSSFRRKHAEYQRTLGNPESRSLVERVQMRRDAIADVESELNAVAQKRTDGRKVLEFWDAVAKVEVGSKNGDVEFGVGGNLKNLISFSLRGLRSMIVRGRARSIFRLRKKFLGIKGYESLLRDAFDISNQRLALEVAAFQKFSKEVSQAIGEPTKDEWSES